MAGRGPAASPTRSRTRDAKRREAEMTKLEDDGDLRGFPLPAGVLPDDDAWHPMTIQWWDVWRRSAQAQSMLDSDWQFLLDTALLHHIMWSRGRWEFASEVRLRVAKHGATQEDRMRLRMQIDTPGDKKPARAEASGSVTNIASRRARLTG